MDESSVCRDRRVLSRLVLAATVAADDAFTYQGRLTHNGEPVTEPVDLAFMLFDAESGGQPDWLDARRARLRRIRRTGYVHH